MSIGKKVFERRLLLDITQTALSRTTGISQSVISDIENERRANLTVETLSRLASALRTTVSELTR